MISWKLRKDQNDTPGGRPTPHALVQARSAPQAATGKLRNPPTVAYSPASCTPSLKLWLLSVTGWWAHPLRRGTNRGTNTQSILGNLGLPERTPWASVQVGRSWRGSGLLVNGRSAVRIRSPAPRPASLARTPVRT